MPSLRDVKRRITSIKNTSKVTHALEAVSATKMRRWQERALHARPFAIKAMELLLNLKHRSAQKYFALSQKVLNPGAPALIIVVSADKGLCGAYNIRLLNKVITECPQLGQELRYVALGKYGKDFLKRRHNEIIIEEIGFGETITRERIKELYQFFEEGFGRGVFSKVLVAYTEFFSTLRQEAKIRQLLPLKEDDMRDIIQSITPRSGKYSEENLQPTIYNLQAFEYLFEPSPGEIIPALIKELTQVALFHMVLESNASEHSARMVAMKNATDNAKELLKGLNLQYNKARQGEITKGVLEVAAGAEALN